MTAGISSRMPLSPQFRLPQFTRSASAEKLGLYNIPREVSQVENLKALCRKVLEPVSARLDCKLKILSGYRCITLNRLMGEPCDSQNLLGQAADILPQGHAAYDAAFTIAAWDDLPFDRLALVHRMLRSGATASYIHLSHRRTSENRRCVETWFLTPQSRAICCGIQTVAERPLDKVA